MSERLKDLIAGFVLILMLGVDYGLQLHSEVLVRFVVLFGVLYHAWMLGRRFLPRTSSLAQTIAGSAFFFSIFSMGLTAWFYSGSPLGSTADTWVLAGSMVVTQILNFVIADEDVTEETKEPWTAARVIGALLPLVTGGSALAFVLIGAARAATTASIRTPWPLLPHGLLAAIAIAWIAVPLSGWIARSRWLSGIQAVLAVFATTAIAPLVYRIGFGFDGFLHLAGERQILLTGTLTPKPLYYIGQYVFTTWMARSLDLPIEHIDRWLVPVAAAILLPLTITIVAREYKPTLPFALLLLPLAPFIATTPQSFAYVLGLAAVILATSTRQTIAWPAPLLLAGWSVATHPLAGVPLTLVTLALLFVRTTDQRWKLWLRSSLAVVCTIGTGVIVPLLFALANSGSAPIHWNLASLIAGGPWIAFLASMTPWIGNRFVVWPAFATLVTQAIPALCMLAWIGSSIVSAKEHRKPFLVVGASGVLLFLSGVLLKTAGDFAFLIDYERGNYAERLFVLGTFCLVVASIPLMDYLLARARKTPSAFSFALLAACGFLAAAQAYSALPRNDALVTGRGWSVSEADLSAVKTIDRDAGSAPYTVLADQSVSAGAVSQLGFKRYNGDTFFYPIPTGGKLYDVFLRMTYQEPSRDTAKDAAILGGSQLVYVVLNDYWWNADAVAQSLESIADAHWSVGPDGGPIGTTAQVYKFIF